MPELTLCRATRRRAEGHRKHTAIHACLPEGHAAAWCCKCTLMHIYCSWSSFHAPRTAEMSAFESLGGFHRLVAIWSRNSLGSPTPYRST